MVRRHRHAEIDAVSQRQSQVLRQSMAGHSLTTTPFNCNEVTFVFVTLHGVEEQMLSFFLDLQLFKGLNDITVLSKRHQNSKFSGNEANKQTRKEI